ncbi:hypothetical protein [Planctomicrobium sp. SH664]|uniref:hypothetical protein n=1 Tax=Planctomicrobium sp. SH664 TaxID=3448125 RepID=UPI003F5B94C2
MAFAWARIGLVVVFVPILTGVGALFCIDEHGNRFLGVLLLLGCLPFLWVACTVPLSVVVDDKIQVRTLLSTQIYFVSDVVDVVEGVEKVRTLTPGTALFGWLGLQFPTVYKTVTLVFREKRKVRFQASREVANRLRERLPLLIPSHDDRESNA